MKIWRILVLLLIIPSASAVISIDGPSRDMFNLGDKVTVKGYILETSDMWGIFKLNIDCESKIPLITRTISLKKDEKHMFEENLPVLVYLEGECSVEATVEVDGNIIEQIKSRTFKLSKSLEGRFEINENLIQLGKDIILKGNVFKLDGTNIDGLATLYFKLGDKISFVDAAEIEDGRFEYLKNSVAHQAGIYNVDISVLDEYGNQHIFPNILQFTLVNEIYVFAKPTKIQTVPGTNVHLIGEAKTILQDNINEGRVVIFLDDKEYKTEIKDSKFSYDISLENDVKSGKHIIEVNVEDNLGNKGGTETEIEVTPVPTELKVEISEGPYAPEGTITLKPILTDQGGDFIIEAISVEIIDAEGDIAHSVVLKTNEQVSYEFSQYAKPGNWEIRSYATGLKNVQLIILGEMISAEFNLANQTLVITNTGNMKYRKLVEIIFSAEGFEKKVSEKVNLKPGEAEEINLGKYVGSGTYKIQAGDKVFDGIYITGIEKDKYIWVYLAGIAIFLIILAYLLLFRGRRLRSLIKKRKEERSLKIEPIKENKEEKQKKLTKFEEEARKRMYAKEFRDRILKELEKRKPFLKSLKTKKLFNKSLKEEKEAEEKPSPVKAEDLVKK